jgi:co-chaperonin GroES (HSP10)
LIALLDVTPARPMRLLGTRLLIRLTKAPDRTKSGLWLPASAIHPLSQGVVMARGNRLDPWTMAWIEEGSAVLFAEHAAHPVDRETVYVYAEDLLGLILESEDGEAVLLPCNDFCLIERPGAAERSRGGIILPPSAQRRARSGRIREIGPGKLTEKGRFPVYALVNLAEGLFRAGIMLYWSSRAEVVSVSSAGEDCCLIRAGDIDVAEVD